MRGMTLGTFIASMFLCFMLGFLACHKLYTVSYDNIEHIGVSK